MRDTGSFPGEEGRALQDQENTNAWRGDEWGIRELQIRFGLSIQVKKKRNGSNE